jgi:uncharacterized protein
MRLDLCECFRSNMKLQRKRIGYRKWILCMTAILFVASLGAKPVARGTQTSTSPTLYSGIRIEKTWILMPDGVKLAVTLYLPESAKPTEKFPAILEYIPYRKDDWQESWDYELHSYYVLRGYVSARVDIRGTGTSEGAPPGREYSRIEQSDCTEAIAWLAHQPWSNGNVGMTGISWGGFNALQMASRRPPALKAIIAVAATENLFHDDIHYIDGIMHADEYELGMDQELQMTEPPDFPTDEKHVAPRFDSEPWFLLYLRHQRNGAFWLEPFQQPVYDSIQIPVYLIGGFYDGYRDNLPRMMTHLKSPVKALLGPWNHTYPNDAEPGPEFEWRESAVRWWDRWLKGVNNGIEKEPSLTVYMRHWYPPDPSAREIPGEWRTENSWPPTGMNERTMFLAANHTLSSTSPAAAADQLKYIPTAGVDAGFWWGELTNDQRSSDAYSFVYDSPPLEQDTAILGFPRVSLNASATAPLVDWMARLSDVAPDGTTTLITGAGSNGAQRESDTDPKDLQPGKIYPLQIEMHVTSWVFPRGHRIRAAISNALWPMLWPTPFPMTTALALGGESASRLILPIVPLHGTSPAPFPPPATDPSLPGFTHGGGTFPGIFELVRDENAHTSRVNWHSDTFAGFPWGKEDYHEELSYAAADDTPAVSSVRGEAETKIELKSRVVLFKSVLELHSDAKNFYYHYQRDLLENGKTIRTKTWAETIPRDHQ